MAPADELDVPLALPRQGAERQSREDGIVRLRRGPDCEAGLIGKKVGRVRAEAPSLKGRR